MKVFYKNECRDESKEFTLEGGLVRDGFMCDSYYSISMREVERRYPEDPTHLEFNTTNPRVLRALANDLLEAADVLEMERKP